MKRLLRIFVTLLLVSLMTACAAAPAAPAAPAAAPAAESAAAPAAQESAPAEKKTVAIVVSDKASSWYIRMEEGVKKYQEEHPEMEFIQTGPAQSDATLQVQVIEDLIAQGVDAICVIPLDPDAVEVVCKKALDAGIVVLGHEAATLQNCNYDLEPFDNSAYGAYLMDVFAKQMGEKGKYTTMVGYLTFATHYEWAASAIARQKEAYPEMELLESDPMVESKDNPDTSYQVAKELLKKYPDLNGILGVDCFSPTGLGRAAEELGVNGKMVFSGTAIPSEAAEFLKDGTLTEVSVYDPAGPGYALCALSQFILDGGEVAEGLDLGWEGYQDMKLNDKIIYGNAIIPITKDNCDTLGF